MPRDLVRLIKSAHKEFGAEAAEMVFRAYTSGLRDGASEAMRLAQDLGREFEGMDLDAD